MVISGRGPVRSSTYGTEGQGQRRGDTILQISSFQSDFSLRRIAHFLM